MKRAEIVPFGKYKGQPVEVLAEDREYTEWLMAQDWFRTKFQPIYTIIVNNFGEPAETPEHNQLQALFTSEDYRERFLQHACGALIQNQFIHQKEQKLADLGAALEKSQKSLKYELKSEAYRLRWKREQRKEDRASRSYQFFESVAAGGPLTPPPPDPEPNPEQDEEIIRIRAKIQELNTRIADLEQVTTPAFDTSVEFEVSGADVLIEYRLVWDGRFGFEVVWGYPVYVECKPCLADDYPAVLRQMRATANRLPSRPGRSLTSLLFIGRGGYTGTGASLEQVKAIFASRQIRIVLEQDVA